MKTISIFVFLVILTVTSPASAWNAKGHMIAANLHSFWDNVLGNGDSPVTALNAISTLPSPTPSAANNLDMDHWLDECFDAAQQTVYKTPISAGPGPFTVTTAYKTAALKLAQKRIALAGARLAKILNEELK